MIYYTHIHYYHVSDCYTHMYYGYSLVLVFFRGEIPKTEKLLDKQDTITLKRCIYAAQRPHLPPIVTHNVDSDSTDPVLNHIRRVHLFNKREDRVKVGETKIIME